jgi:hypothetical protein
MFPDSRRERGRGACGNACGDYRPVPEWRSPDGHVRFEDIPGRLRYSDCECGATWIEHHPEQE